MIPNNNLSVLPWYTSLDKQNARRWWVYGREYPLYTQAGYILPFQIMTDHTTQTVSNVSQVYLYEAGTGQRVGGNYTTTMRQMLVKVSYESLGYDVWVFGSQFQFFPSMQNGQYYMTMLIGSQRYYSEVFTVVNDIEPYLKIEWWDDEDFVMDAGAIVYRYSLGQFKNVLYLRADIAKPEYIFEEEGETRDGYFFPTKQISEKKYRFSFFASEYLLDVMRLIRMADYVEITKLGKRYSLDTFLITPEWEGEGDVASVSAEFQTATVAKKVGVGYIKGLRGDFNDDFNDDFNNQ